MKSFVRRKSVTDFRCYWTVVTEESPRLGGPEHISFEEAETFARKQVQRTKASHLIVHVQAQVSIEPSVVVTKGTPRTNDG